MSRPNWNNRTLWTGDNLDIMRGMNSESVDLIYLDPPFNSNRNYAAPIGSEAAGAAFKDTWTLNDVDEAWHGEIAEREPTLYAIIDAAGHAHGKGMKSYLIMMAVRLMEMQRLLNPTGSIYLHCDPTASHYLKTLMDAIVGQGNFRSEITWRRINPTGRGGKRFANNSDNILYYTKGGGVSWNPQYKPHDPVYVAKFYRHVEPETGRRYRLEVQSRSPFLGSCTPGRGGVVSLPRLGDSGVRWGRSARARFSPGAAGGRGALRRRSDLRKALCPADSGARVQVAARMRVRLAAT